MKSLWHTVNIQGKACSCDAQQRLEGNPDLGRQAHTREVSGSEEGVQIRPGESEEFGCDWIQLEFILGWDNNYEKPVTYKEGAGLAIFHKVWCR